MSWKYTDASRLVAFQVNTQGGMDSCLVTVLPTGTVIADPDPVDTTAQLIAAAWTAADALAASVIDHNSRERFLAWLMDPSASATKKQRIQAVMAWMDGIWQQYYATVAQINAGNNVTFSYTGSPCPWTFIDVANS
jgi:hypothetical protein